MQLWLDELDTYTTKRNIVKMIVGNKIDQVHSLNVLRSIVFV